MAKRKCNTQVFPYDDLTYCYGKPVLGGIRPAVYAIPAKNLLAFPTLCEPKDAKHASDLGELKGRFYYVPDRATQYESCFWHQVGLVPQKNSLTWETQGEHPARTFLNKARFVFPGTCEEATAFARQAIHDFLIFAVQQTDGSWRILGSPEFPADVQVSGGTGEGLGGEVGINIEITATSLAPAPFYAGEIVTNQGDIIFAGLKRQGFYENLFYSKNKEYGINGDFAVQLMQEYIFGDSNVSIEYEEETSYYTIEALPEITNEDFIYYGTAQEDDTFYEFDFSAGKKYRFEAYIEMSTKDGSKIDIGFWNCKACAIRVSDHKVLGSDYLIYDSDYIASSDYTRAYFHVSFDYPAEWMGKGEIYAFAMSAMEPGYVYRFLNLTLIDITNQSPQ